MSKPKYNHVVFKDSEGYLCAVRRQGNSLKEAIEIAKKALFAEDVEQSNEYTHMYFGYGTSDGEQESTWWLVDNKYKNGVEVFVFREK